MGVKIEASEIEDKKGPISRLPKFMKMHTKQDFDTFINSGKDGLQMRYFIYHRDYNMSKNPNYLCSYNRITKQF